MTITAKDIDRLAKINNAVAVLVTTSRKIGEALGEHKWDVARELFEQQHRNLDDIAADFLPIAVVLTAQASAVVPLGEGVDRDEDWYCEDCGEMIDSASKGCENEHCGETPDEKRIREAAAVSCSECAQPVVMTVDGVPFCERHYAEHEAKRAELITALVKSDKLTQQRRERYAAHKAPIAVGDLVRSFDFASVGIRDSFAEGIVEAIGPMPNQPADCDRYHIRLTRRVMQGEELPLRGLSSHVYPPVNGSLGSVTGRPTDGVERVESR